ncbi:MAG TPA: Calx-beta domain-containing protein, partial [Gemmatimonadaceae bacterium]|nr:Calx-beta domain-containing protein [Gemmatimonadaceae bacterium]
IPLINDTVVESAKTFTVALSSPVGTGVAIGTNATVNVTLNDNDSGVAFVAPTYSAAEGVASVTLTVRRMGPATAAASVRWTTADGTATAGQDFGTNGSATQRSGSLSWAAGDATSRTIVIPILNDTLAEGTETFTVSLNTPSGVVLGSPSSATVSIADNDSPPATELRFSQPKYVVLENGGNAVLTVNRVDKGGGFGTSATVRYATQAGTAAATSDFTAKSGTLTWAAGDSAAKTIAIPIVNDAVAEAPEMFKVLLSAPSAGTGVGTPDASVLILDDDEIFPPDGVIPNDWVMPAGADGTWHVSNDPGPFEGAASVKSDSIDDGQSAEIQVARTFGAGNVSFRVKVSSEPGFDVLRFYVDGVAVGSWSGTTVTGWQAFSYPLTAGAHTLKWAYEKDASGSLGQDAAWIDAVVLP